MLSHKVKESHSIIEKSDHYEGTIEGYDIIFTHSERNGALLSIYPAGNHGTHMGLIQCRPDSVTSIEDFATVAEKVFKGVAAELRELGRDDLRDKFSIAIAELDKKIGERRVEGASNA